MSKVHGHDKSHVKPIVIEELSRHGVTNRACRTAGITRQTLRRWRAENKEFDIEVAEALRNGKR